MGATPKKLKALATNTNLDKVKKSKRVSSSPSSPFTLQTGSSAKQNCLCSPTTHVGSFRCRYHRNPGLTRNGLSVDSKLSGLASVNSKLSQLSPVASQVSAF